MKFWQEQIPAGIDLVDGFANLCSYFLGCLGFRHFGTGGRGDRSGCSKQIHGHSKSRTEPYSSTQKDDTERQHQQRVVLNITSKHRLSQTLVNEA